MKKLYYIANARMPTEKAHGIQIAKMCEAFANNGVDVTLVIPKRARTDVEDIYRFFGVKKNFAIASVWCLDGIDFPFAKRFFFWLESWTFAMSVARWMRAHGDMAGIIYTRDLASVFFLSKKYPIAYEAHALPQKQTAFFLNCLKRMRWIISITEGLKEDLAAQGIAKEKILVAPDAVDMAMFDIRETSHECRKKYDLPIDAPIAMYTGHFYGWKGTLTLLDVAALLRDVQFVLVGGTDALSRAYREMIQQRGLENVRVIAHTPHANIPSYLRAADVLLLPNSASSMISAKYTSPLKLFEYMAARRPIVASDLPSIREVLDESTATFFTPDDPQSLAGAIRLTLSHVEESMQKADRAFGKIKSFGWKRRAERILDELSLD